MLGLTYHKLKDRLAPFSSTVDMPLNHKDQGT